MFGSQQRRKSASIRVCKNPKIPPKNVFFSSFSDFADYREFGRSRYFVSEYEELKW
jgi:hypothetical protein